MPNKINHKLHNIIRKILCLLGYHKIEDHWSCPQHGFYIIYCEECGLMWVAEERMLKKDKS